MKPEEWSIKKQAEKWLDFAESDLITAEEIINNTRLTRVVAFHTHQCVEKALKALLELYDKRIPYTHDLVTLTGKIEESKIEIVLRNETLEDLNQVYIETRYPADHGLLPGGDPT